MQKLLTILSKIRLLVLFFAGLFLAIIGFKFYKDQKNFDTNHLKESEIRELATSHLMRMDMAYREFNSVIAILDGTNPVAKLLLDKLSSNDSNYFYKQYDPKFKQHILDINTEHEKLMINLSFKEEYAGQAELIKINVQKINSYLGMGSLFDKLKPHDFKPIKEEMSSSYGLAKKALSSIVTQKI